MQTRDDMTIDYADKFGVVIHKDDNYYMTLSGADQMTSVGVSRNPLELRGILIQVWLEDAPLIPFGDSFRESPEMIEAGKVLDSIFDTLGIK